MNVQTKDKELTTADLASTQNQTQDKPMENNDVSMATKTSDAIELLVADEAQKFRNRWSSIQGDFVDEPRRAVEEADTLVAELMKRLAEIFADERSRLEGQWGRGDNVSTEDLRMTLQRYRSFFNRLLSL